MQPKKTSARSKPARKPKLPRGLYHKELSEAQEIWLDFFNSFSMYVANPESHYIPAHAVIEQIVTAAAYFADRALDSFEHRWGEVKLPEED